MFGLFKNISKIKLVIFLNIVGLLSFLIIYNFWLKKILFLQLQHKDAIDIPYYVDIFNFLNFSIFILILILSLLIIFSDKIILKLNTITEKKFLLFSFSLSFLLHLFIILLVKNEPISDSLYYVRQAKILFETGKYLDTNGNYSAFWPVGIPAILSLLMYISQNNYSFYYKILNVLLFHLSSFLLYDLFKKLISPTKLKLFLLLWLFFPNNIFSSNIILTDYPFLFTILIALYIITKQNINSLLKIIFIGLLSATASYLRPTGLFLPLIFGIILSKDDNLKLVLKNVSLIFLVQIIFISPWIIRNYIHLNTFVPMATNGGLNFLMGNHKNSNGGVNFNFEIRLDKFDEIEANKQAYQKAFNDILDNPLKSILRIPIKLFRSYYRGDSSLIWSFKKTENFIHPRIISFLFFLTNLFYYNLIFLSLLSLVTNLNKSLKLISRYLPLIVYFYAIVIIYYGTDRYIFPILPFHILLAINFLSKD